MEREFGIDSLRLTAAFFIITHHIDYKLFSKLGNLYYVFGSWALFYFFIISGYFVSYKGRLLERSMETISRILSIHILWTLIYLPTNLIGYGWHEGWTFFFRNIFSVYYHLYFLIALIIGILLLNYFEVIKKTKIKVILALVIIFYFFASSQTANYHKFLPFTLPNNIIFYLLGIPFVFYGNYIATNKHLSIRASMVLVVIGTIVCFIEGFLMKFSFHYLGGILIVLGTVNFALNKPKILNWGKLSVYGGRYGLGIYLVHPLLLFIYEHSSFYSWKELKLILPFVVIATSFLIFHFLYNFSPKLYKILTGNRKLN